MRSIAGLPSSRVQASRRNRAATPSLRDNTEIQENGMMDDIDVLVSEVGPRDGLQNTKQFMPTEYKKKWISAAAAAGLREIEVCSFVPPKLIPQMVDAPEIVAHALTIAGLNVAVLAPNLK